MTDDILEVDENDNVLPLKHPNEMTDDEIRDIWSKCVEQCSIRHDKDATENKNDVAMLETGAFIEGPHYKPMVVLYDGYYDETCVSSLIDEQTIEINPLKEGRYILQDYKTLYLCVMPYQRLVSRNWDLFQQHFEKGDWFDIIEVQSRIIRKAMDLSEKIWNNAIN